jgi:hypothetical protein
VKIPPFLAFDSTDRTIRDFRIGAFPYNVTRTKNWPACFQTVMIEVPDGDD